jgi:hypothetical protein
VINSKFIDGFFGGYKGYNQDNTQMCTQFCLIV